MAVLLKNFLGGEPTYVNVKTSPSSHATESRPTYMQLTNLEIRHERHETDCSDTQGHRKSNVLETIQDKKKSPNYYFFFQQVLKTIQQIEDKTKILLDDTTTTDIHHVYRVVFNIDKSSDHKIPLAPINIPTRHKNYNTDNESISTPSPAAALSQDDNLDETLLHFLSIDQNPTNICDDIVMSDTNDLLAEMAIPSPTEKFHTSTPKRQAASTQTTPHKPHNTIQQTSTLLGTPSPSTSQFDTVRYSKAALYSPPRLTFSRSTILDTPSPPRKTKCKQPKTNALRKCLFRRRPLRFVDGTSSSEDTSKGYCPSRHQS